MRFCIYAAVFLLSQICWSADNVCSLDLLTDECRAYGEQPIVIEGRNGYLENRPALANATSEAATPPPVNPNPDEAQRGRMQTLFSAIRENMLSEVSKGRARNKLSAPDRNLFDRIQATSWILEPRADAFCEGVYARHARLVNNKIHLCPRLFSMPDLPLVYLLGHELAHSIDPCTTSDPLSLPEEGINIAAISYETHPFLKQIECLRVELALSPTEENSNQWRNGPKGCNPGRLKEGFPDLMSARTLFAFVKANRIDLSDGQTKNRLEMAGFFGTESCASRQNSSAEKMSVDITHPSMTVTMDKMLLAHPGMIRELGCRPQYNYSCDSPPASTPGMKPVSY